MKTQYRRLLLAVLVCTCVLFVSGCVNAGHRTVEQNGPNGKVSDNRFYFHMLSGPLDSSGGTAAVSSGYGTYSGVPAAYYPAYYPQVYYSGGGYYYYYPQPRYVYPRGQYYMYPNGYYYEYPPAHPPHQPHHAHHPPPSQQPAPQPHRHAPPRRQPPPQTPPGPTP